MKFFVIPPLSDLQLMHDGTAGYFLLAHLYMSSAKYRNFVLNEIPKGSHTIMDNGAAENSLVTEEILFDIVKEVNPTEVIAPDVLFNKDKTIANAESFIDRMVAAKLDEVTDIFFCPQGESVSDWLEAYEYGMNNQLISTIGMSKIAVPFAFLGAKNDEGIADARHMAVDILYRLGWIRKPLHFLGMGDPREFDYYRSFHDNRFRSTDSCYSVLAGMENVDFNEGDFRRIPTPHDYFDSSPIFGEYNKIHSNIEWMKARLS